MPNLDSLYRRNAAQWPSIYANRFAQLGNTATIVNFGDQQNAGKVNATTFTGYKHNASGLASVWTPSAALSAFSTAFDLTNPSNFLGSAPVLTFNGTSEKIDTPDAAYWSRDDTAAQAVSYGGWAWIDSTGIGTVMELINKWHDTNLSEWIVDIRTTGKLAYIVRDESTGANPDRTTDAAVPTNSWINWVVTYDGSGGATAMNGVTIYINGVAVASTATNDINYVGMENSTRLVNIGYYAGVGAGYFKGKMLGGPFGIWSAQVVVTAAQVLNLYSYERLALGV